MDRPDSDAEFDRLKGPPLVEVVSRLRVSHRLSASRIDLERLYAELVDEAYAHVALMPHAAEVLAAAKRADWIVGVVTSNGMKRTRAWLERARLSPYVDLVISGDDVSRGKPDPEPYHLALERAGADPALSIAVEDSLQGAAAARGAGLSTFLLLESDAHALGREGLRSIGSLAELLPVLAAAAMPAAISC
jgi:sugar-phosphatase